MEPYAASLQDCQNYLWKQREVTIKIMEEKIRLGVKGGAQDTDQYPVGNEEREQTIVNKRSQSDVCASCEK